MKLNFIYYLSFLFPTLTARKAISLFLKPKKHKRPPAEEVWYKAAKKRKLNSGLAINEWGLGGNPKVLLIHGWEGRGSQMGAFAEPFVQKGYHVIALDGPAHGESPGDETNAGVYARALVSVQHELGDVKVIIGHSFGGGCSVLAASLGMNVEKLVTICSPSDYSKVAQNFLNFVKLSPWSEKAFYKILTSKAQMKLQDIHISNLGSYLSLPILVIHDKTDKEVHYQNALDLHKAWSQSELLTTQGLGHRRILKDHTVIEKVIEFSSK
jgi:pimeloyl-ACP methyl ester carboxylesterase